MVKVVLRIKTENYLLTKNVTALLLYSVEARLKFNRYVLTSKYSPVLIGFGGAVSNSQI